ncbi:hypothetical protein KAZ01_03370 [Candidatus Gracilibacteria bacterium]|nr:hypothetical protein [Candidatus Gracilibacteria bacterium]
MRLFSYILSFLATFFLVNIILSYTSDSYHLFLNEIKIKFVGDNSVEIKKTIQEQVEVNKNIALSLDKLNENLNEISKVNKTNTGSKLKLTEDQLGLPDLLLLKIMPEITPKKVLNSGIFGLKKEKAFTGVIYTTFFDTKNKLKIYIIDLEYNETLSRFMSLDKTFETNETNNFFGYTFYLNPIKKDTKIRFITLLEGKTIGFEIDKNKYENLKKLLLR